MKMASGRSVGARVGCTCQKLLVPASVEIGGTGAWVGKGFGEPKSLSPGEPSKADPPAVA
jgi:hypothetical protein